MSIPSTPSFKLEPQKHEQETMQEDPAAKLAGHYPKGFEGHRIDLG